MKLSVIVPSYNVSNYLEECVESIIDQNIPSMEVLIINDGSTDNTLELAIKLEYKYSQVRVIDQPNGGLGNARNTGIKEAKGEFLTFVDSDDVISESSYRKMLNTIEESGSDFIIGNVVRFNSTREYDSVLHKRIFTEDLIGVNVHSHPELLYDTTAWNKIFRMDFWNKYNFVFPEKMLYEDIPVTIPAHAVAQKVDVLTDVVYKWRARDAGDNSITQQKENIVNFTDRVRGIDMVRDFFEEYNVSEDLKEAYDYKNLSMDFPLYLNYMLDVPVDYQMVVKEYVQEYMKSVSSETFMRLFLLQRIKYRLIELNRFDDFLVLLKKDRQKENIISPTKVTGGFSFPYSFSEVLTAEERIADVEFDPISWIEEVKWEKNNLKLKGVAYINKINSTFFKRTSCKILLRNENSGTEIKLYDNYIFKKRTDVTLKRGHELNSKKPFKRLFNYTYSGFEIIVPENILNFLNSDETYYIVMELKNEGITKELTLGSPLKGYHTKPQHKKLDNNIISPSYNAAWGFKLVTFSINNCIENIELNENGILLRGKTSSNERKIILFSERSNEQVAIPITYDNGHFEFLISKKIYETFLKKSKQEEYDELLCFKFKDVGTLKHNLDKELILHSLGNQWQLTIMSSQDALFRIRLGEILPIVTSMSKLNNEFNYKFRIVNSVVKNSSENKVVMKGETSTQIVNYKVVDEDDGTSTLLVNIPHLSSYGDRVFSMYFYTSLQGVADSKYFCTESLNENSVFQNMRDSKEYEISKHISEQNGLLIPICLFNIGKDKVLSKNRGIKYELYHSYGNNHLQYRISSYWEKIDDGPRRQEVVRRIFYPIWRKLPLKNNIFFFESFWGREFSDNPKAIYEYLLKEKPDMKFIISIQDTLDESIQFEHKNTQVVKLNSWRYIYYLARSKYFFNNVNFPDYYKKRKKAVEVQTMHGTPLKKLGLDNPGEIPDYKVDEFIGKCKRWDYLTIPSDYVGEIAQSAYQYSNELLKTGYPRNDSLFNYDKTIKTELLKKYNLPTDKKIILYAPTWRVKGKFSMPLDLLKMKEQVSDEYILLIKLHHYMVPNFSLEEVEDFAFLFGKESQISDFYKLADILITDYSSVMFDYAILKKPMIFFTYDYENYKNNLREMYFNFQEEAPGPLVETTEAVVNEIKNIEDYDERYAERIEKFRTKFVQYDKGNACEQLVNKIVN